MNETADYVQERLTRYACDLKYEDLAPQAIHAVKVRCIDTLGALVAGFWGEPCRIVRELVLRIPNPDGATVLGTRIKTSPDMAAFANATAARYAELNDAYQTAGTSRGHPSDYLTPLLGVAECERVGGRDFITSAVLNYEVFVIFSDILHNHPGFDFTTLGCLSSAVAAAKIMGLSANELSHCISMAVVPNVILRQVRTDRMSMFKATIAGQSARAGIFAAMLARAGMEGPDLPFEGKAGWCDHVNGARFSLGKMGGKGEAYGILKTVIKNRPTSAKTTTSVLAAEKAALTLKHWNSVQRITIEMHKSALESVGSGDHAWNPLTREDADHSVPYLVAATLMEGSVNLRSFDDAHLNNPDLRALMKKIVMVENDEFTRAYCKFPQEHHSRISIDTLDGEQLVGKSGGDSDDLSAQRSDDQIAEKFRNLTDDILGAQRVNSILDSLWHLDDMDSVAEIPLAFVLG
jgi:2-methylcitrate dehydratase